MNLRNLALTTGCGLVLLCVLTSNLAAGTQYCDCTNIYKAALPNGSHCADDTTFNTWTLNCDPKPAEENKEEENTGGGKRKRDGETEEKTEEKAEETSTVNKTAVALQLEEYKAMIHNYTAYNSTLYPLNSTCQCNCTYGAYTNDTIYFNDANQTVTTTKVTEGTKKEGEATVVTKVTVNNNQLIEGWWKINSTTTTTVTTTTTGGITQETAASETKADNVSSHWLEVITVVGQCPTPEVIGLQCYNCLFIPSMNYSVCLDPNKNCPYKCSKTVYNYIGIDYFVSTCYNDSTPNDCRVGITDPNKTVSNKSCAAEVCDTDWCNTYVPLAGLKLSPSSLLVLVLVLVTVSCQWYYRGTS